jgi:hypothetical protein
VIEHIPDDGDSRAMREIARVLRPGGIVTISVPFDAAGYDEEYLDGDVYERRSTGGRMFYQRWYDLRTLHERLIEPSGLRLLQTTFFGEPGPRFQSYWNPIPMHWKAPLLWTQPFLAKLFLKRLSANRLNAASGVVLSLAKPESANHSPELHRAESRSLAAVS